LFLDVEGDEDPISANFLRGWCEELKARRTTQIEFLPAIYTSALNSMSVRKAIVAVNNTCHIEGLWLARYMKALQRPTAWPDFRNTKQGTLIPFPDNVPIYAWQYWARNTDPKVDLSLVNPALVLELEQRSLRLHAPPASEPVSRDSTTSAH
jgi:hypothetical protein